MGRRNVAGVQPARFDAVRKTTARHIGDVMNLNWRKMKSLDEVDVELIDGEEYLTEMKHGYLSGTWDAKERIFRGYYWNDLEWWAYRYVPISEIQ